jgi:hypothetical protein
VESDISVTRFFAFGYQNWRRACARQCLSELPPLHGSKETGEAVLVPGANPRDPPPHGHGS